MMKRILIILFAILAIVGIRKIDLLLFKIILVISIVALVLIFTCL